MRAYRTTLAESDSAWARLVSDLVSPPVVWMLLGIAIAFRFAESGSQALLWVTIYVVLICVLPVIYIVWNVRRGKITDIHMKERRQRLRPFLFSIMCSALGWVVLTLMNTPQIISAFALFSLLQLGVLMVITLVWQISIHAMSITGVVVATGAIFGLPQALVLVPLVPLVGMARIKLHRHTLSQVLAGTLVGALLPLLLFILFVPN
ncbi:MAG: hypothetical protein HXY40_01215 [Chloroflexi bacterium]|nr:hypothetical protein [Chloroflexota bacterium]